MIGKILGTTIKIATLPVDAANAAIDVLCGGSGDKESRNSVASPLSLLENIRDAVIKTVEEIDNEKSK